MNRCRHRIILTVAVLTTVVGATSICPPVSWADEEKPVRKPGIAFLLSALLPGAGQLYLGQNRAYVYFGVEAAAWFARFSYLDAGNQKEGEFEAYARRHWNMDRYRAGEGQDGCEYSEEDEQVLRDYLESDVQQYYEAIGKYDRYQCGWDDFRAAWDPLNPDVDSPNRSAYKEMRATSNEMLDRAQLALVVTILNRIVSGVDAFRSARARQQSASPQFGLRLESDLRGDWDHPRAELRLVKVLP